jgi:hypothetical protein
VIASGLAMYNILGERLSQKEPPSPRYGPVLLGIGSTGGRTLTVFRIVDVVRELPGRLVRSRKTCGRGRYFVPEFPLGAGPVRGL